MSDVSLERKLLELLAEVDFDRRYYAYYESHRSPEDADSVVSDKDLATALSQTALEFEYTASEHLFRHKEVCDSIELMFGVGLLGGSDLEFLLYLKTSKGFLGGPFPKLAREVGQVRDPAFTCSPRSPKLPVSRLQDLQEAVQFGLSLFEDARNKLCSFQGWTEGKTKKPRRKRT